MAVSTPHTYRNQVMYSVFVRNHTLEGTFQALRRDLKRIRGRFEELSQKCFYDGTEFRECYLDITLTDEQDVPDALQKLRLIYPYIMHLGYDNRRTRQTGRPELPESEEELPAEELIREFYRQQNGQELTSEQAALLAEILEETEAEP